MYIHVCMYLRYICKIVVFKMIYEILLVVGCTYYSGAEKLGRCGKVNARQPLGDAKGENEDSSDIAGWRPAKMRVDLPHRGEAIQYIHTVHSEI